MNHKLSRNPHWKGGRYFDNYKRCWMIKVDKKYVREHRYLMEQKLGYKLPPATDVTWLDGDRTNNDLSNLKVSSHSLFMHHLHRTTQ